MKAKTLIAILLLTQAVFSQNENSRKIGDFKILKVYDLLNIELERAEENYAVVTGEYSNNTVIKNKNGELKLRMGIEKRFRGSNTKIKIFYNNIEKIYAHEGAFVYSKDTISQAGIYIKADEGAKLVFNINTSTLSTNTSSGAIMDLQGKTAYHRAKVHTGGELKASKLETQDTEVFLTTGAVADVFAKNKLEATVRAGGAVNVHSKTKKIEENILAGGSVNYLYEN